MKNFQYTVETKKSFEEAVSAVEQNTAAKGFRVLHTHDVTATLAEKGFQREPLKIVEICNAKYAHEVLQKDINVASCFRARSASIPKVRRHTSRPCSPA